VYAPPALPTVESAPQPELPRRLLERSLLLLRQQLWPPLWRRRGASHAMVGACARAYHGIRREWVGEGTGEGTREDATGIGLGDRGGTRWARAERRTSSAPRGSPLRSPTRSRSLCTSRTWHALCTGGGGGARGCPTQGEPCAARVGTCNPHLAEAGGGRRWAPRREVSLCGAGGGARAVCLQ
jgi:hypothetical protein